MGDMERMLLEAAYAYQRAHRRYQQAQSDHFTAGTNATLDARTESDRARQQAAEELMAMALAVELPEMGGPG